MASKNKKLKPEELARVEIDRMIEKAGWAIVNRDEFAPNIPAVAVREGLMNGNKESDYLLFLNGKAIGVLEAKKKSRRLNDVVAEQAENYAHNCPNWCESYENPLPIVILSNGDETCWKNLKITDEDNQYIFINEMLRPKDIKEAVLPNEYWAGLPNLKKEGLRDCQYDAITKVEEYFKGGVGRVLVEMATGAGKTFTACSIAYRMLNYTPMRRVLFLVDRNNLGRQAESAFGNFKHTENNEIFSNLYSVQRLRAEGLKSESSVVISTIQKLFSAITGEKIEEDEEAESCNFDDNDTEYVRIGGNTFIPKDYFDLIIIDECHRSIYGKWKEVLNYFETAKLVGLTATPGEETYEFFKEIASRYSYEDSVKDGVNVGYRVYRIKTDVTENGGTIKKKEKYLNYSQKTSKSETVVNAEVQTYEKKDINRSVDNLAQIETILTSYKNAIYTQLFVEQEREPKWEYIPKTLIFALNERHAQHIVEIARRVFSGQNEKFVQQITYSSGNSDQLIREFNNDVEFRIAVTVTLVATGTDVRPLEVVMFMRDVNSEQLYKQMRGRGCRTINDEQLKLVTPNAKSKDLFYVVDAVGVTEHEMNVTTTTGGTNHYESLKIILEKISHGYVPNDILYELANRISRINSKSTEEQRNHFTSLTKGFSMQSIAENIFGCVSAEDTTLPDFVENGENKERKQLVAPLAENPDARSYLLELNAGFIKILTNNEDVCTYSGFSQEDAQKVVSEFEKYITEQQDNIEALRILKNDKNGKITYEMLKNLKEKLLAKNSNFSVQILWENYATLNPKQVTKLTQPEEKEMLTNLIQLVRYAFKQCEKLESLFVSGSQYFNLWCGQIQRSLTDDQKLVMRQISDYILANGFCDVLDIRQKEQSQAVSIIQLFGGIDKANEALFSLSNFLIYHKAA